MLPRRTQPQILSTERLFVYPRHEPLQVNLVPLRPFRGLRIETQILSEHQDTMRFRVYCQGDCRLGFRHGTPVNLFDVGRYAAFLKDAPEAEREAFWKTRAIDLPAIQPGDSYTLELFTGEVPFVESCVVNVIGLELIQVAEHLPSPIRNLQNLDRQMAQARNASVAAPVSVEPFAPGSEDWEAWESPGWEEP